MGEFFFLFFFFSNEEFFTGKSFFLGYFFFFEDFFIGFFSAESLLSQPLSPPFSFSDHITMGDGGCIIYLKNKGSPPSSPPT